MAESNSTSPSDACCPKRLRYAIAALFILGIALRVWRACLADLPLRIDEIRVAWNLFNRDLVGLIQPLDHRQAAPVGFLWLVDLVVSMLGRDAWILRLIPLLAGIGVMILIPLAVRRVSGRVGLIFAIALTALAPWAIQYSSDLKQYSMDVLCTAAVLLAALSALKPEANTRSRIIFAVTACIALLFSHPAALVVAGFGLSLIGTALFAKRWRIAIQWVAVGTTIAAVLAVLWWVNLRHVSGRDDLMTYWARNFMPIPPRSWSQAVWYPRAIVEWLNTSGFYCNPLILVFAAAGLFELRKRPALLALLMSPVAITLLASAFHAYPFSGRMIVFLMPCTVVVLAVGGQSLAVRLNLAHAKDQEHDSPRQCKGEWIAIAAILLSFAITYPYTQLASPWVGGRYDFREPFGHVAQDMKPGDGLIVESRLYFIYKHYAEEHRLPADAPLLKLPYFEGDPRGQAMHDEAMKHDRLWILAGVNTRVGRGQYVNTHDLLLPLLEEFGPPTRVEHTDTVSAWLFERSPTDSQSDTPTNTPSIAQ